MKTTITITFQIDKDDYIRAIMCLINNDIKINKKNITDKIKSGFSQLGYICSEQGYGEVYLDGNEDIIYEQAQSLFYKIYGKVWSDLNKIEKII